VAVASSKLILEAAKIAMEVAAAVAVKKGAEMFAARVRARTPSNRKKTRRHTVSLHRDGEQDAVAGVIFPPNSRYETSGTVTRAIVDRAYREDSQIILQQMEAQIAEALAGQQVTQIEIRKG